MNPELERPKFKHPKAAAVLSVLLHAPLVFAEPEPTAIINETTLISEAPITSPIPKLENISVSSDFSQTEFYQGFSDQKRDLVSQLYLETLNNSNSVKDYFAKLNRNALQLSFQQKIYFLQRLGLGLSQTYNSEMASKIETIEISEEKMFEALKNKTPSGLCGNIHTFMVKAAQNLGLEAWLQSGYIPNSGHVWMGTIAERAGKKEIVFVDYDSLIPTGTLDYQEALGIMERRNQEIFFLNSFVGDTNEVLFPIKSQAQEVMEKAAGFESVKDNLSQKLKTGKIEKEERTEITKSLSSGMNFSSETKSIKFTQDYLGLYFIDYQNLNDPYNSLENLNATRFSLRFGSEKLDFENDLTLMHINIRDLGTKLFPRDLIVNRLAASYINSAQLNKDDYGQFVLNYGAIIEAGLAYFLQSETSTPKLVNQTKEALGIRLAYLNPNETGKIFIGVEDAWQLTFSDFQNQDSVTKEISKQLVIGGEYRVKKGIIVNLEIALAQLDYGQSYSAKASLVDGLLKLETNWLKEISQYEQFQPSKDLIEGSISVQFPFGEINFFGSIGEKKYKDAEPEKIQNIGLKLKIIL